MKKMINKYIRNHKLSLIAHEEITAMIHSDNDVAYYFYKCEMNMTHKMVQMFENNGFNSENINEKVHVVIGMIDNLCHEIVSTSIFFSFNLSAYLFIFAGFVVANSTFII